jgi:hypothetical protein
MLDELPAILDRRALFLRRCGHGVMGSGWSWAASLDAIWRRGRPVSAGG